MQSRCDVDVVFLCGKTWTSALGDRASCHHRCGTIQEYVNGNGGLGAISWVGGELECMGVAGVTSGMCHTHTNTHHPPTHHHPTGQRSTRLPRKSHAGTLTVNALHGRPWSCGIKKSTSYRWDKLPKTIIDLVIVIAGLSGGPPEEGSRE
jgi:hypothetical protein